MKKVLTVIGIAAVCHALNKALCASQGDNTQPDWENAPDWQKDSAVNGVNFHLANPDAPASASHENWMKEKLEAGWKYGPVKDVEKKEHPCLIPFDELPNSQQAKDYLFKQTVHELAPYIATEEESIQPNPVRVESGTMSADEANGKYGERYGIDWVFTGSGSETSKPDFETKLAKGDEVMLRTGGPKMKVDVVFNTPLGVKAHCTWPLGVGGKLTSDVFFEHNLHKFEPAPAKEEAKQEGEAAPDTEKK